MIPDSRPEASPIGDLAGAEQPISGTPTSVLGASPEWLQDAALQLAYPEFVSALKDALRDFHRPDLLSRNPLLRYRSSGLDSSAGPPELKALLSDTVATLFGNGRDEKVRRAIELTYFQPALKQEAVADRLSLAFGSYRRYLTTARDRLARWLWENARSTHVPPEGRSTSPALRSEETPENGNTSAPERRDAVVPRLSIVVLPFVNLGGTLACDQIVDGITETLTTDLSRQSDVFVISRSTACGYKGKPVDSREIGRELGVRYILEGSVQGAGERIRFNAQLIDAASGAHLWAERFDKECNNLFDLQDEVTTRLARTIHVEMIAVESRRSAREPLDRLDSIDHSLRGRAAWNQHLSLEAARQARHFFEAALRLDPSNVEALLGVANTHLWEVNMYASQDRSGQIRAAAAAATEALALVPENAEAHVTYGTVLFATRVPERALREFNFAIELDPNLATAHGYLGLMKFFLGRAHETRAHIAEAIRLSPRDPLLFHWHFFVGIADIYLGRVVHGLENLRKSVEINPNWGLSQFCLAGALALAGLLAEADEVCAVARRLAPNFTIAKFRDEAVSDNPVYLAQREHMYSGLRLAGVPEG